VETSVRFVFLTALVGLLLAGFVAPSRAQCPDDVRATVQRELDLTDARIDLARSTVSTERDRPRDSDLARASDAQDRARREFAAGNCFAALDLTRRARARALQILSVGQALPDSERVRLQVSRTREVLDRARERVERCDRPRARSLFGAALEMQRRAEAALAADPPRPLAALQLTVGARDRSQRAQRLCNVEAGSADEGADRALRRTEDVLGRARSLVASTDSERAKESLRQAQELQDRAVDAFRAGRVDASLRLTQDARALGFRAMRLASRSS
jgi:hypothetical protein